MSRMGLKSAKVGVYVRESRDDNDENYETIETQRELLIDYIEKNNIGSVIEIYEDNNVSGSVFERQGINKLKKDVLSGYIDMLVLKDLSRLGRNNAKTLLFLDFLEEYGVTVLTSDGRYDSRRDNDTVGIDTWYNERYVRDISRKIRANLHFKIQKGEYIGHAPFGYRKAETEKNRLVIDLEKAPVIRMIFDLYLSGYGYSSIARLLNIKGYTPPGNAPEGGIGWNAVTVGRILANRVYLGDTVQGISEKVSFKSKKTRRLPADSWVITCNTHEPIVSIETFEAALQLRLGKKSAGGPHKGDIHLFKGLLFCGGCGSKMVARLRKDRPMGYICSKYARDGKSSCTSHYINEKLLENEIMMEISNTLMFEDIRQNIEDYISTEYVENYNSQNSILKLEQQLLAKERQQDILYQDKLDGKISEELFIRTNKALETRLGHLKTELLQLQVTKKAILNSGNLFVRAEQLLQKKGLDNRLLRLLTESIIIFDSSDNLNNEQTPALTDDERKQTEMNGGIIINFKWIKP